MKIQKLLSLFFLILSSNATMLSAQNTIKGIQNEIWIGAYKSAKISYGRIYQLQRDTVNANAVNYMGGIYFWVGAKLFGNQPQVVAGDGNHLTGRPEWKPLRWKKEDPPVMEIDAIEDITISEYNDRDEFEGHTPMGVFVRQTVYSFENKPYQVFNFEVTNLGDHGDLKGVYLAVVGHFRLPDLAKKRVTGRNDLLRFVGSGKMPVVMRAGDNTGNAPLIGIIPLSDKKAKLNFWKMEKQYITDSDKYALMSSEGNRKDATEPGIYNFIWSSGPYDMPRWTPAEFSIALMQAEGQTSLLTAKQNSDDIFDTSIKTRHNLASLGKEAARKIPEEFLLKQNYPNPFNPTTTIEFSLPQSSQVRLTIYNILGQRIRTLANTGYQAGEYALQWDGRDDAGLPVSSGIYIYEIQAGDFVKRNKMAFVK